VLAVIIGFFFLVTVMVATAQQDVVTRMKAEGLSNGYSSALSLRRQVKEKADAVPALQRTAQKLAANLDGKQTEVDQAQRDFDMAWDAFKPSVARLKRANLCDLAELPDETPGARAAIAGEVKQCQLESSAPTSSQRALSQAQADAEKFSASSQTYLTALEQLNLIKRQQAFIQAQITDKQALSDDERKAERSFGDMDVLLQPWVFGGYWLVQFPPALLQFLLTFVSGLFGALLVTLILIVYPNQRIANASIARAVPRTFLGGCIAMCVYIVLLSGTAVLGSGNSSSGAGTNYMAFCGIGILAGMFSDRVAGWLSKRADELFKQ
jgi:hypothetical protein